jgi:YVTN family beta-propeller protein
MRFAKLAAALFLGALLTACGGNSTPVGINLFPTAAVVVLNGTQQFSAIVTGTSNTNVVWSVGTTGGTPIVGGNSTLGTISTSGLYTAPAIVPNPNIVVVTAAASANLSKYLTANVTIDSGIRVTINPTAATIGTGETFTFTATVTGTSNIALNWLVNSQLGGNSSVGTITNTGLYSAPATAQIVTVSAQSVADTNQTSNSTVTIVAAADPVLDTLEPSFAPQGSVLQNVYLAGTCFFSTNQVLVNGTPVPTTFISVTFLRAEIPSTLLGTAGPEAVTVQRQNGDLSAPQFLSINPVRPAVVSSSPTGTTQGTAAISVGLDGGFYSQATTATFNGQSRPATLLSSRQLNVGLNSTDTVTPGLFQLVAQNAGVTAGSPSLAATNLSVQPNSTSIPTSPIATIPVGTTPVAVAVNTATGIAAVVNSGVSPGTVSLIDTSTNLVTNTVTVGEKPSAVAIDNLLDLALIVNNGDNTVSILDLSSDTVTSTVILPGTTTGYSVGVNPLTHRALVANQNTNAATVLDLTTIPPSVLCVLGGTSPPNSCTLGGSSPPVSTGPMPAISVDPHLNWAIVTPGGAGTITIVDLGTPASTGDVGRTPNVVATLSLTTSVQGIAVNPETNVALLTDPNNNVLTQFSLLDQTVSTITLDKGEIAAAVNPLTNVGVTVNNVSNQANIVNLQTMQPLVSAIPVGVTPAGVAIDPDVNVALVANSGDNTVSVLSLGTISTLDITQSSPQSALTGSSSLTLTLVGNGFEFGSFVRLDQTAVPTSTLPPSCTSNCRELTATIPSTMLASPRRYALDVLNPGGTISNVSSFTVIGTVSVGNGPSAVSIDPDTEQAVVTNYTDGTVSIVDLTALTAGPPIVVGANPVDVAILPRLSTAIVTNFGGDSVSLIDLVSGSVFATTGTESEPLGVAIQPDTATAFITNSNSNTVQAVDLTTGLTGIILPTDMVPVADAVDTDDNVLAVANASQNTVLFFDILNGTISARLSNLSLPTDVTYDPIGKMFIVANSLQNNIITIDPITFVTTTARVGINPQSLAYNFQTSTLTSYNNTSHTLSVIDYLIPAVRDIIPVSGSAAFSVAIDPSTNIAAVADQINNRLLLIPLPR